MGGALVHPYFANTSSACHLTENGWTPSRHVLKIVLVFACNVTAYNLVLVLVLPCSVTANIEAPHQKGNNREAPLQKSNLSLRVSHMDYGIHTVKRDGPWFLRT